MRNKNKLLLKAQRYAQKGYSEKAVNEYKKILAMDPNDVVVRLRLGDLYVRMDKEQEAVEEYTEVARIHSQNGFFHKAIAVYKQVLKLDDSVMDVYLKLADLYDQQGLSTDAIFQYMMVMKRYEKDGLEDEVIDILKKILTIAPHNVKVKKKLAEKLREKGLVKDALSLFPDTAIGDAIEEIEIIPEDVPKPEGYVDLAAELGVEDHSPPESCPELEGGAKGGLEEGNVEDSEVHYYKGIANMEIGLYDEAIREFEVASLTQSLAFDSYTRLGFCFMAKKEPEEAVRYFEMGLKETGRTEDGYKGLSYELGLAYEAMGKQEKALETFQEIEKQDKDFREVKAKVKALSAERPVRAFEEGGG